jgi:hypothetical protein
MMCINFFVLFEYSPGLKWPGLEADRSPLSSAEVKYGGAMPPLPHMSAWHDT